MPMLGRPNDSFVSQSDEGHDASHTELPPQMIGVIIAGLATFLALATLIVAVLQLQQGSRGGRLDSHTDLESTRTPREESSHDRARTLTEQSFGSQSVTIYALSSFPSAREPDPKPKDFAVPRIEKSHAQATD